MSSSILTIHDASEVIRYNNINIPYYVRDCWMSGFDNHGFICHWHNDFEIVWILSGQMYYSINGKTVILRSGDILIINSKQMHYGYSNSEQDCNLVCYLVDPMLLAYNNESLYNQLIEPIKSCDSLYWMINNHSNDYSIFVDALNTIHQINNEKPDYYEYRSVQLFQEFFYCFRNNNIFTSCKDEIVNDQMLLRKMITFISQNYKHDIQIEDIAKCANISRTKCCQLFKTIDITPIEFLNHYRLEVGHNLLLETSLSITAIATEAGFNDSSYFTKKFKQKYKVTPKAVRKF